MNFDETPDWYEVQNVAEIEDFDPDQYGNVWYNVKFVGNAETFMWLAKEKPEEGKKYHGHFEKTKSGKRLRFKRTPKDDIPTDSHATKASSKPKSDAYLKDISNTPIQIYNGSLNYAKEAGLNIISDEQDRRIYLEYVQDITNEMLKWIDNIRNADKEE